MSVEGDVHEATSNEANTHTHTYKYYTILLNEHQTCKKIKISPKVKYDEEDEHLWSIDRHSNHRYVSE